MTRELPKGIADEIMKALASIRDDDPGAGTKHVLLAVALSLIGLCRDIERIADVAEKMMAMIENDEKKRGGNSNDDAG